MADDGAAPWHAVGLGTPAGNALFRLYGGRRAQDVGNTFSAVNRARLAEKPPAPPPGLYVPVQPKRTVNVPRPTGRVDNGNVDDVPRFHGRGRPGKKPVETIQLEIAATTPADPPKPSRPLLDDREKERCATLMHFRGKYPEKPLKLPSRRRRTERDELEAHFAAVQREIAEREEFLEGMEARGRGDKYRTQIGAELDDRIEELKRIDKMLDKLDAEARATLNDATNAPSPGLV